MAKKIEIIINDESNGALNGLIEISSQELIIDYANDTHAKFHGLQSNYEGDSDKYLRQLKLLDEIADKVCELISINK